MYTIKFNFEQQGLEPVTLVNIEPGQTLLETALGNDIDLHHNCGGVCSCTTCHLYIKKGIDFIDAISKREKDFLERIVERHSHSRLACQSLLTDDTGDIEILVPDQRNLPDEYYA